MFLDKRIEDRFLTKEEEKYFRQYAIAINNDDHAKANEAFRVCYPICVDKTERADGLSGDIWDDVGEIEYYIAAFLGLKAFRWPSDSDFLTKPFVHLDGTVVGEEAKADKAKADKAKERDKLIKENKKLKKDLKTKREGGGHIK